MAGGSDGEPDERARGQAEGQAERPAEGLTGALSGGPLGGSSGGSSGGQSGGLSGGLSGGEWWRVDGPWRVFGTASGGDGGPGGDGDSVYGDGGPAGERAVHRSEAPSARRATGPETSAPSRGRSILRKRPAGPGPEVPAPSTPEAAGGQPTAAWLIAPASPGPARPPTVADFPGWDSVVIDFPPDDTLIAEPPQERLIPEQRQTEEADPAGEGEGAVEFLPTRSLLAGRRPSPLLLLAIAVLVGGAVTGLMLVLLAGWGLAYLSRRLGDLTRKFAVFGIPLVTMSFSALWFWGRAQGRWGTALGKGAPTTHALFAAGPGVLRLAAVLSALFLLAVTMRRRRPTEG